MNPLLISSIVLLWIVVLLNLLLTLGTVRHMNNMSSTRIDEKPNHWVDISEAIDKKVEARCAHISQVQPANPPGGYLRKWGTETGKTCGYAFAESFHYIAL